MVDDGSTDRSATLVEQFAARHPGIRLIRHERNKGTPFARNTVLDNFRGEYLAYFDDDDRSLPSRIREQYQRLAAFPEPFALCFCHWMVIPEKEQAARRIVEGMGAQKPEPHGEMVAAYYLRREAEPGYCWGRVSTNSFMARRSTLERIGHFDPAMRRAQDVEYAIRAAFLGCFFISVDKVLVEYHLTGGNNKNALAQLQSQVHLARKYKQHLSQYRFLVSAAEVPIRKTLKEALRLGEYFRLIRELMRVSPRAGLRLFFRPKNMLRMLRMPFVKFIKRIKHHAEVWHER